MNSKEKLLLRAKNGDIEAYEILTETYWKRISSMASSLCANKEEPSRLAQEVFVTVYKSFEYINTENQQRQR